MATNYATTLGDQPFFTDKNVGDPPPEFQPTPPTHPGSPSAPTYPGTLNSLERAEVEHYLVNPTDAALATLRLPDAIAMAITFKSYNADPAIKAYLFAVKLARDHQWKIVNAGAAVDNRGATPPLASAGGAGGGTPPAAVIPPAPIVPDPAAQVEDPELTVDTGTVGSTPIDVSLTCATGGATIYYRLNSGSFVPYTAPVTMAVADQIWFYAAKAGYLDSATGDFDNN
jgi:hypothetical protein